ncbi:choice-of-anchor I family protein [Aliiglaciecola sp. CAU 1673]|uniref:choice-of-anchor I family protein n=1 Tax=Aliiglaciecola sp. CAU 1673 TaxID=3032595 RepID=UPI0023DA0AD4|nr:choice-of-anchor I family protein [Aliiglaciecola sp. CAU 1673]MDF2176979.1 choice-of-anchor I family protein [Aliiglaciecola sp. CAU 1673]
MSAQNKFKYGLLALFVGAALTGCGLDGDDGAVGPAGAQGPQGEQGTPGQDGQNGTDASMGVSLSVVARAALNPSSPAGAAEIVQFHAATNTIYALNSATANPSVSFMSIAGLPTTAMADPINTVNLAPSNLALRTDVRGKTLVAANSIAISGDIMAVAMVPADKGTKGEVLFYNGLNGGTPNYVASVEVGYLPDMVTFTPDGSKLIVANEGEPRSDYSMDPEGSVSVIEILVNGSPESTADHITFTSYNDKKAELEAMGMHFPNPTGRTINGNAINTTVAQDLEPEYITASNTKAYVTLQENNGLAVVDLTDMTVTITGLGFKDWSDYMLDGTEDGTVSFGQYDDVYGMYQPDSIASYQWKGASFLVTANEGDAREYFFSATDEADCTAKGGQDWDDDDGCLAFSEETQARRLNFAPGSNLETIAGGDPEASNFMDFPLGRLTVTDALGDADGDGEYEALYAYGARSFTIWDTNGLVVFDSGDDFERITASVHGNAFNNDNDVNEGDSRSANKGPEPEALTVGKVGERTYAFIGLERMGGIFVYDITNPYNTQFVDYVFNRGLTEGATPTGDLAPEGMVFVPAANSPSGNALLVVGNEVSGTVTVWQIAQN